MTYSYENEEMVADMAAKKLHPPVKVPGQKPISLKEQQKAQHSAVSRRKEDHRKRFGTPVPGGKVTQAELDLGLAPVIDLQTGKRRKKKELLPLLQCEGLNQYGLPCNHMMRTTRREGRRIYCHQHEYQRAGYIKLRCKYYDECHNTINVKGHANAVAMRANMICGWHERHMASQVLMAAEVKTIQRELGIGVPIERFDEEGNRLPSVNTPETRAAIIAAMASIPGQPNFNRPKKQ